MAEKTNDITISNNLISLNTEMKSDYGELSVECKLVGLDDVSKFDTIGGDKDNQKWDGLTETMFEIRADRNPKSNNEILIHNRNFSYYDYGIAEYYSFNGDNKLGSASKTTLSSKTSYPTRAHGAVIYAKSTHTANFRSILGIGGRQDEITQAVKIITVDRFIPRYKKYIKFIKTINDASALQFNMIANPVDWDGLMFVIDAEKTLAAAGTYVQAVNINRFADKGTSYNTGDDFTLLQPELTGLRTAKLVNESVYLKINKLPKPSISVDKSTNRLSWGRNNNYLGTSNTDIVATLYRDGVAYYNVTQENNVNGNKITLVEANGLYEKHKYKVKYNTSPQVIFNDAKEEIIHTYYILAQAGMEDSLTRAYGVLGRNYYVDAYTESDFSDEIMYFKLHTPSGLNVKQKVSINSYNISWNKVDNADVYVYKLDNGMEISTSINEVLLGNLTVGKHKIKVKARSNEATYYTDIEDSPWSDELEFEVTTLPAPVISVELDTIKWTDYNNDFYKATGFIVEGWFNKDPLGIDQDENWTYYNTPSTLYYVLTHKDEDKLTPGIHKFRVKAIITDDSGNEVHEWSSPWSNIVTVEVQVLDRPVLRFINDSTNGLQTSIVVWDPIPNALKYNVYVNLVQVATVTDCRYEGLEEYVRNRHEDNPGEYQVTVMAMADLVIYANSDYAEAIWYQIDKVTTPAIRMSNSGLVTWNPCTAQWLITSPANLKQEIVYDVYKNGDYLDTTSETSYNVPIEAGTYANIVWVQARATNQHLTRPRPKHLISDISNIESIGKYKKPINLRSNADGYLYWDPVENANTYIIYNEGTKLSETSDTRFLIPNNVPNTFIFTVQVDRWGNIAASDVSDPLFVTIKKLDTPQLHINAMENYIYWDYIPDATYYQIFMNNSLVTTTTTARYDFSNVAKNGENKFYIFACNDSQLIINSDRSNIVTKNFKVSYRYYVKIKENGVYSTPYELEVPISIQNKRDDSLETAIVTLTGIYRKKPFEAYSDVQLCFNTADGENPFKTLYYLIANDNVTQKPVGQKTLYSHTLQLISRTRFLQSKVMPNFTVTQPKSFVIQQFRQDGSAITPNLGGHTICGRKVRVQTARYTKVLTPVAGALALIPYANKACDAYTTTYFEVTGGATNDLAEITVQRAIDKSKEFILPYFDATKVKAWRDSTYLWHITNTDYSDEKYLTQRWYIRKHVDSRSDQYSKYDDTPEVQIATYNYGVNTSHPTFSFDKSQYYINNSSQEKWDLILEVDDIPEMKWDGLIQYEYPGEPGEGPIKLTSSGILNSLSNVKENRNTLQLMYNNDGDRLPSKTFRVVWEGISVGNVSQVEQEDSENIIYLSDTLTKLCDIVNTKHFGESSEYYIDENILKLTSNIPTYQLSFQNKTFYECLETLGKEISGIPYLREDTNEISFHIIGDKLPREYEDKYTAIKTESSIDNNATGFISECSNVISKDNFEIYPSPNGWISARATDYSGLVSVSNAGIILDKPIAYLKSVYVTGFDSKGTIKNITPFIYEKSLYDCLAANKDGKGAALYWSIGDNRIYGMGQLQYESELYATLGYGSTHYVIQDIIEKITGEPIPDSIVKDLKFRIVYKPYTNTRLTTEQFNTSEAQNNIYKVFNQTDNCITDTNFAITADKQLRRVGNNSIFKTFKANSVDSTVQVGDAVYIDNDIYYANNVTYEIGLNNIDVSVEYTKDDNKINPRMGIDSAYRQYEIYASDFVNRTVPINHYCYLGTSESLEDNTYSTRTGIWSLVIESMFNKTPYDTLDTFYIRPYGIEGGNTSALSYLNYDGTKVNINYGMAVHATRLTTGNSITFSGKMFDNFCAGYSSGIEDQTNGRYKTKAVRYVDNLGRMPVMDIALGSPSQSQLFNSSKASYEYPLAKQLNVTKYNYNNCVYYDKLYINKDNREALTFTYQMHFKSLEKGMFLHPGFTRYMFKNNIDSGKEGLGNAIIVGYKGIIDSQNFINYSSDDIIGNVTIGTTAYGTKYIRGINSFTPRKNFDGYAIVYDQNPENKKGEILLHNAKEFKIGVADRIPAIYFNFKDNLIERK